MRGSIARFNVFPTRGVLIAMLSGLLEWFALQRARLAGPLR
jgi:hypothetical protein